MDIWIKNYCTSQASSWNLRHLGLFTFNLNPFVWAFVVTWLLWLCKTWAGILSILSFLTFFIPSQGQAQVHRHTSSMQSMRLWQHKIFININSMISSQAITRQFANYINSPWRRYNVGSWKAVGHHHTWDTAASAWSIPDTLDDNSSLGTRALDNYSAGKCPSADRQSSTHTAHNRTLCNYFLVHRLVHASICKVALFCITLAIHPSCSAKTLAVTHTHTQPVNGPFSRTTRVKRLLSSNRNQNHYQLCQNPLL